VPHSVAITSAQPVIHNIQAAQLEDPVVKQLRVGLLSSSKPVITDGPPTQLNRYLQFWEQLPVIDNVVCRTYNPRSSQQSVTVPVLPFSMQQSAISQSHDIPIAGHQGISKTLPRIQESAYWVGMAHDVAQYCAVLLHVSKQRCLHPLQLP